MPKISSTGTVIQATRMMHGSVTPIELRFQDYGGDGDGRRENAGDPHVLKRRGQSRGSCLPLNTTLMTMDS